MLQATYVNGVHILVILTWHAQPFRPTSPEPLSSAVADAADEHHPVRRGSRIPIIAAIISSLGVVAAALVAGVFTIWGG